MRSLAWALVVVTVLAACTSGSEEQSAPTGTASRAEQAAGFPPQPDGVPFPTEEWAEGEWPSAVVRAPVDEAVDVAFADGGGTRVRAVVIVHGGKLVYERYSPNSV